MREFGPKLRIEAMNRTKKVNLQLYLQKQLRLQQELLQIQQLRPQVTRQLTLLHQRPHLRPLSVMRQARIQILNVREL
jgi:hypothetical protein